ncbi:MAG: hypothetical protein NT024_02070, partial [Proteobacteria bacterium]|nr:hypothetical protein [Pseudomonadota bacterium]
MTEFLAPLLLATLIGAIVAALISAVVIRRRTHAAFEAGQHREGERARADLQVLDERLDARARENTRLNLALTGSSHSLAMSEAENKRLVAENAALLADQRQLSERIGVFDLELKRLRDLAGTAIRHEAEIRTRLEESARTFTEKEAVFKETSDALKQEFQLLANRIFEEQGQSFAHNNRTQLDGLLTPFREQIAEFKQRVEQVYHTESKDRA